VLYTYFLLSIFILSTIIELFFRLCYYLYYTIYIHTKKIVKGIPIGQTKFYLLYLILPEIHGNLNIYKFIERISLCSQKLYHYV